ncbi:MAG: RES domain-containing protein [Acidobacteriota bacterium]|jgi:RES domain-containing protein
MMTSWRVVRGEFAARAFDGEGARVWGGRWNSPGHAIVYTSATTSLGLLEKMVHADLGLPPLYITVSVTFDAGLVETVELEVLPDDWRSLPAPFTLKQIGDEWADSNRSCILEVPSVIVPHESNFILNPQHEDFTSIQIGEPIDLDIDQRLA